ncbi:stigma-specific STIG1-like protein 2 [Panicum miliaceum]|uniref:Stigma-specific STIG1-like protein 2 n=1 Tax=Panicum miliaceum TaxID=4540 RepID=A0A3L6RQ28_PANMI|nr:stigma-specific STIG1-like protein 2 [Panicum miliaceum]
MADGAGQVISTSLLLAVLFAASAATSWCAVAANAPTRGGSARQVAGGANDDGRGMLATSRFFLATAAATREIGQRACRTCSAAAGGAAGEEHRFKCCGGACTDVLASAGNCGACGRRCPFGRLCCGGRCPAVAYDAANCVSCGRACAAGTPCTYGMCGYAA